MRSFFRSLCDELNRNKYLTIALIALTVLFFATKVTAAEPPTQYICIACEQGTEQIITALSEINHSIDEATLGMMASLLWIIGLLSFGLGISVMTIFAIIWGRNK
jgi:hypothetical protein